MTITIMTMETGSQPNSDLLTYFYASENIL